MSFFTILETLLLGPLKLLFEIIFQLANRFVNHPGLSIIFLSLIMNILVLPLYKRADAMQEEARDMDHKLHKGVAHIKKVFSGDEKMMILQTYYRQNHYKPTDALNGSVSLLLEIPFFMAAYQFLSHLEVLNGVSLGPISDLAVPDGMLVIGGVAINLLPILMTLINVISSAIYLKGFPLKTKIQLYGMALFFLVFLYESPAGLVFYWTLNNVFSLVKTIFYKLKNPRKVIAVLTAIIGVAAIIFGAFIYNTDSIKRKVFIIGIGIFLQLPMVSTVLKTKIKILLGSKEEPDKKLFFLGSLFMTLLIGVLIPSTFIAASPQEYVDVTYFHHPLWYLVSSACLSMGTFLVWMRVFYWLAGKKGKSLFGKTLWILCGISIVNYMFFGTKLGVLSHTLQYENDLIFTGKEQVVNFIVLIIVAILMCFIATKWKRIASSILLTAIITFGIMSTMNIMTIEQSVAQIDIEQDVEEISIPLSKEGKNVVVLMLDRAIGGYLPYFLEEKPELKELFAGFTYYSNTISFGGHTNFAAPALLGGYEYTPVELNKREEESLVSKHNEALQVMPVLFSESGYNVTVSDPPYANYQWIPDLTVFDDYQGIKAYNTKGRFNNHEEKGQNVQAKHRDFFCFSIMKCMPLVVQPTVYNRGTYNKVGYSSTTQLVYHMHVAEGRDSDFMDSYNVLKNLSNVTNITEEGNTFFFMNNELTHEPMLLQEPEYLPLGRVDNTKFYDNTDRFVLKDKTLNMDELVQVIHYQTNMCALLQLGQWFDYLREQDVYDNTRIIIVSDHGLGNFQFDELICGDEDDVYKDVSTYYPLLMVKDFESKEFTESHDFMTNADVPTLAVKDIINNPTNPFTGKAINNIEKTTHDQYIIMSEQWDVEVNNGTTFLPSRWASVRDGLWNKDNWNFTEDSLVLKEHNIP